MRQALAGKPAVDFAKPETVVVATIDPATGYLATIDCPEQAEEFYVAGTAPTEYCPEHGGGLLDPLPETTTVPESKGNQSEEDGEWSDIGGNNVKK